MNDEAYRQAVVDELDRGDVREWLWKEALSESGGDETQARTLYIPKRIAQMKQRRAEYAEQIQTLRGRAQKRKTWGLVFVIFGGFAMAASLFAVFERPFMGLMYAAFWGVVGVLPGALMLRESSAIGKEADQLSEEFPE